ncbi:SulP family inorganic anion transporter [Streptomyces flavidovirens]|uniref:SulP family inorganic anion transporter n=1 Tax=Streptomyces flavidovirens TaxID=67298 RepID=A0ABW6RE39_9ACTN
MGVALIASAESLFSATAVDRLHDGSRTDYDKELIAGAGAGNAVRGALPMTAAIVRSMANVRAGGRAHEGLTGAVRGAAAGFRGLPYPRRSVTPVAALAGVLVHGGWKLIPVQELVPLWRERTYSKGSCWVRCSLSRRPRGTPVRCRCT